MAVKKNNFLSDDLEFCRLQVDSWKKYIEDNPYHLVEDRKELMKTKTGGAYYAVVQTKEVIQKALRDTAKDITAMLENIKRLEVAEENKKKEARGGDDIPESMQE